MDVRQVTASRTVLPASTSSIATPTTDMLPSGKFLIYFTGNKADTHLVPSSTPCDDGEALPSSQTESYGEEDQMPPTGSVFALPNPTGASNNPTSLYGCDDCETTEPGTTPQGAAPIATSSSLLPNSGANPVKNIRLCSAFTGILAAVLVLI